MVWCLHLFFGWLFQFLFLRCRTLGIQNLSLNKILSVKQRVEEVFFKIKCEMMENVRQ